MLLLVKMIQGYLRGKTHSALILIQVITHRLELIVWFQ